MRRLLVSLAWGVCGFCLVLLAAHLLFLIMERALSVEWWGYGVATTLGYVGIPVVGAVIVSRIPRHPCGWVWLGVGWSLSVTTAASAPVTLRFAGRADWLLVVLAGVSFTVVLVLMCLVFLLFPDGHLPSRRWRWVTRAAVATAVVLVVASPFAPPVGTRGASPLALPDGHWLVRLVEPGIFVLFGLVIASTAAVPVRWHRAGPTERQQLKWFLLGAAWFALAVVVTGFFGALVPAWVSAALNLSMFLALPAAVAVAILRHRLYDVDRVINRTLLYAGLSACLLTVYVSVVTLTPLLLAGQVPGLGQGLAAAAVALLVLPVRSRLQRAVNRLTFGRRGDPYDVMADLGRRLDVAATPEALLPGIVESVARTLRLPYVAVAVHRSDPADTAGASYGQPVADPVEFPLHHHGEPVGRLLASPRRPGDDLSVPERRLLADLAGHAGAAAHAVLLGGDLRRARARVLAAREEERRRLRRDLHDGLGPTLAAVVLGLESARRRCEDSPQRAAALLDRLSADVQATITDIRRLVHDLRPPVLDQLGLIDAIRAEVRRFETEAAVTDGHLWIRVDTPPLLPPLPAAVEVVAYRITGEALTNVVRHAHARLCVVRVAVDDGLELEVRDDGRGISENHRSGVGLFSMIERAVEAGGSCDIGSLEGAGTRVLARFPLDGSP